MGEIVRRANAAEHYAQPSREVHLTPCPRWMKSKPFKDASLIFTENRDTIFQCEPETSYNLDLTD